jgi:hypothetical protein
MWAPFRMRRKGAIGGSGAKYRSTGGGYCTKMVLVSYKGRLMLLHFHLYDGETLIPDQEGGEFADLEAARAEARASVRELAVEDIRSGRVPRNWQIRIADPAGFVVDHVVAEFGPVADNSLSPAQFASLAEIGRTFLHDVIPSEDSTLLQERGLIYRLLGSFRLTTAGRNRLRLGP